VFEAELWKVIFAGCLCILWLLNQLNSPIGNIWLVGEYLRIAHVHVAQYNKQ